MERGKGRGDDAHSAQPAMSEKDRGEPAWALSVTGVRTSG
jgi:hypothetical protein